MSLSNHIHEAEDALAKAHRVMSNPQYTRALTFEEHESLKACKMYLEQISTCNALATILSSASGGVTHRLEE